MSLAEDRIAKGQCPTCGKEAAPYRLCYDCRWKGRMLRMLKRGAKVGCLSETKGPGRQSLWSIADGNSSEKRREWDKWQTGWHLKETDRRGLPMIRGIRIDIDATLMATIVYIGRPCAVEEIMAAFGRLRDRRSDPLPVDLACIIKAQEKRERRAAKAAALHTP